jgi:hypothetical protein
MFEWLAPMVSQQLRRVHEMYKVTHLLFKELTKNIFWESAKELNLLYANAIRQVHLVSQSSIAFDAESKQKTNS